MTKHTKELLKYIGLNEEDAECKIDHWTETDEAAYICYDGGLGQSGIFELTASNLYKHIDPSKSIYRSRLSNIRRKMGIKSFKDFTVDDWLRLLSCHDTAPSRYEIGSLFGTGGVESYDNKVTEIDSKKYMMYYINYFE